MSDSTIFHKLIRNAASNYLRTFVALVAGVLTFRLLYGHFSKEEFGFWCLLWSLFGFGVLLDFGFGFATQKKVAELLVRESWIELSRVLSSVLAFYTVISVITGAVVLLSSKYWIGWFGVSPENTNEFQLVLLIFFSSVCLSFPLGIFPEILRGQQRIHVVNWLIIISVTARIGLIYAAIYQGWSFSTIMLIAAASTLAPDLFAALFAFRQMPAVKLSPRLISIQKIRETASFSVYAYLGTIITLLFSRTDQLVLSTGIGLGAIVIYQAGAKVSEMFRDFTRQLQEALSPAAASLHAGGNRKGIQTLLIEGTRWSALIATPLYLLCAFYLEHLLLLLTGDPELGRETWIVGQILLFWYYTTILTHSISRRVFMMTGHEKRLTKLGFLEVFSNLALSIILVTTTKSVVGVVIGSLLPTLWFGWIKYWPWMIRESGLTAAEFFRKTIYPAIIATAPAFALLLFIRIALPHSITPTISAMFFGGAITGLTALYGVWSRGMKAGEKMICRAKFQTIGTKLKLFPTV